MKEIYFDDNLGVHVARYNIFTRPNNEKNANEIVLYMFQKHGDGMSLINADKARTQLLNTILKDDLYGIQLEHINFFFEWQSEFLDQDQKHCWKFELDYDLEGVPTWKEPQSILLRFWYWLRNKEIYTCWANCNIVAGKVNVISNFEKRSPVTKDEIELLRQACL